MSHATQSDGSTITKVVTRTHVGRVRRRNEDACGAHQDAGVLYVADGMGGHPAGDIASRIAARCADQAVHDFLDGDIADPFDGLAERIQRALNRHAERRGEDWSLGTTFTAVRFLGDGRLDVLHIGDSRAYLFSNGVLHPITQDHSHVGELVRAGGLTREQARTHPASNIVTRCLVGDGREVEEYDRFQVDVATGGRVLLCTDGLTDMVPEPVIEQLLADDELDAVADMLVVEALARGGHDNISLILAET